jgi:hypothetical protein
MACQVSVWQAFICVQAEGTEFTVLLGCGVQRNTLFVYEGSPSWSASLYMLVSICGGDTRFRFGDGQ